PCCSAIGAWSWICSDAPWMHKVSTDKRSKLNGPIKRKMSPLCCWLTTPEASRSWDILKRRRNTLPGPIRRRRVWGIPWWRILLCLNAGELRLRKRTPREQRRSSILSNRGCTSDSPQDTTDLRYSRPSVRLLPWPEEVCPRLFLLRIRPSRSTKPPLLPEEM